MPIQDTPEVKRAIMHDLLVEWLKQVDVSPEVVQQLVVGYCKRNKRAYPTPPIFID
jgi:hypothetical protein